MEAHRGEVSRDQHPGFQRATLGLGTQGEATVFLCLSPATD